MTAYHQALSATLSATAPFCWMPALRLVPPTRHGYDLEEEPEARCLEDLTPAERAELRDDWRELRGEDRGEF